MVITSSGFLAKLSSRVFRDFLVETQNSQDTTCDYLLTTLAPGVNSRVGNVRSEGVDVNELFSLLRRFNSLSDLVPLLNPSV